MNKFHQVLFTAIPVLVLLVFITAPISGYFNVRTTRQAINTECGTLYSLFEVATSGAQLLELCRIRNQRLTLTTPVEGSTPQAVYPAPLAP